MGYAFGAGKHVNGRGMSTQHCHYLYLFISDYPGRTGEETWHRSALSFDHCPGFHGLDARVACRDPFARWYAAARRQRLGAYSRASSKTPRAIKAKSGRTTLRLGAAGPALDWRYLASGRRWVQSVLCAVDQFTLTPN